MQCCFLTILLIVSSIYLNLLVIRMFYMKLVVKTKKGAKLVFEGDPTELATVADKLTAESGDSINLSADPKQTDESTGQMWNENSVRRLLGMLHGDMLKLVKFLANKKATYGQVEEHMGYKAQKLSGVLAAITRNSRKATKNSYAWLINWRWEANSDGQSLRQYYVEPSASPNLKKLL